MIFWETSSLRNKPSTRADDDDEDDDDDGDDDDGDDDDDDGDDDVMMMISTLYFKTSGCHDSIIVMRKA